MCSNRTLARISRWFSPRHPRHGLGQRLQDSLTLRQEYSQALHQRIQHLNSQPQQPQQPQQPRPQTSQDLHGLISSRYPRPSNRPLPRSSRYPRPSSQPLPLHKYRELLKRRQPP